MSVKNKTVLREQLQVRRSVIPDSVRVVSGHTIIERLIQMVAWPEVRLMQCYAPIVARGEVDTWPLFSYVWDHWPHIRTAVPGRLRGDQPVTYAVNAETSWHEAGAAPLPKEKLVISGQSFDLIIIPCLGFDKDHYRLGYGGGYYDRLLSTQTKADVIGLAFWNGYVPEGLPHERHDVPLRRIITEQKVL